MAKINSWQRTYEYSRGEQERFDLDIIPKMISGGTCAYKTDPETDRKKGIDYWLVLRNGAKIGIDAKTRERGASKYWRYGEPELALETWSVKKCASCPNGKVGWTLDESKESDMILYTFNPCDTNKIYLIPFQHLRMAFIRNYTEWKSKYKEREQNSDDDAAKYHREWQSSAIFVPASVVIKAVADEMQFEIGK